MRRWVHQGWALCGATALAVGLVGCAAQRDDSLRLSEELGRARADSASQRARAAELESRLSLLEQRAGATLNAQRAEDRELRDRLARLIETNERVLAEHAASAPSAPVASTAPSASTPSACQTAASNTPALSDEQMLRALVERLRGRPGSPHGGLTREQENALRLLSRPERTLDSENPWPASFY